jgi:hypothetical protein
MTVPQRSDSVRDAAFAFGGDIEHVSRFDTPAEYRAAQG